MKTGYAGDALPAMSGHRSRNPPCGHTVAETGVEVSSRASESILLGGEYDLTKAYWVSCYRKVNDPEKLAAYAKLAGPAIEAGGGRFLARAPAARAYEDGVPERIVVIEFESLEKAIAVHDSAAYQAALAALGDGAVRDLRLVAGI